LYLHLITGMYSAVVCSVALWILIFSFYFFFSYYAFFLHLHSFPTRRSSDLTSFRAPSGALERGLPRPAMVRRGPPGLGLPGSRRSEEHTSELQSRFELVCRLLLEK